MVLLLIALNASAEVQAISSANTSRYSGNDRWDWTVFIKASPKIINDIKCVQYTLHPTFPDPMRTVCRAGETQYPFALSSNGWGTFEIPIKITFKNGQTRFLKHNLQFVTPRVAQAVAITADNTATKVSPDWWNWTVFIKGPNDVLAQISCVEYTLHPTFPDPTRKVCSRGTGPAFSLSSSGWGTFQIRIRVFLRDGKIQELTHDLKF